MGCFGCGDSEDKEQQQRNDEIEKMLEKDKQKYKSTHRLLLLGMMYIFFLNFFNK